MQAAEEEIQKLTTELEAAKSKSEGIDPEEIEALFGENEELKIRVAALQKENEELAQDLEAAMEELQA
ncbi:MAG: hypothetical protein ACYTFT_15760 [Planctomycetota bacterium]